MKTTLRNTIGVSPLAVWLAFLHLQSSFAAPGDGASTTEPARASEPIPWSEIGTKATLQYAGDGLAISAVEGGAVLRCVFQQMNARATAEGLWITSTVDGSKGEPFRVVAVAVGREGGSERGQPCSREPQDRDSRTRLSAFRALPASGTVEVAEKLARFVRPGVTEEYSVSMDGVRQDFVISEKPDGSGELRVELDVTGAKVEALTSAANSPNAGSGDPAYKVHGDGVGRLPSGGVSVPSHGARLVLKGSGRKIAYSRLRSDRCDGQGINGTDGSGGGRRAAVTPLRRG